MAEDRGIEELPLRISSRIVEENGCWIWTGSLNHNGYGRVWWKSTTVQAHRLIRYLLVGDISINQISTIDSLDHLCRVRNCVNPSHLEPTTIGENIRRGWNFRGRPTYCHLGHPLFGKNLYVSPNGERKCRECSRYRDRLYRERRKNA